MVVKEHMKKDPTRSHRKKEPLRAIGLPARRRPFFMGYGGPTFVFSDAQVRLDDLARRQPFAARFQMSGTRNLKLLVASPSATTRAHAVHRHIVMNKNGRDIYRTRTRRTCTSSALSHGHGGRR